jgi:hypothetical protein
MNPGHSRGPMPAHFPQGVPEIPVSNVDKAAEYHVNVLGFRFDWGNDDGGMGGISQANWHVPTGNLRLAVGRR